jgi:hypothetical protein
MNKTSTNQILVQRIKRNNKVKGVLVGIQINDTQYNIGWSFCKKTDTFDFERGKMIAEQRALKRSVAELPVSMNKVYNQFTDRCNRYFKGQTKYTCGLKKSRNQTDPEIS